MGSFSALNRARPLEAKGREEGGLKQPANQSEDLSIRQETGVSVRLVARIILRYIRGSLYCS